MKKQYAVFGLGSFGKSVALTMESLGCDVVAVDNSYERVQEISDDVAYAIRVDVTDPDAMQTLGGRNLDGAVVAISDSLEASIMATMIAKEMGIPYVLAKARDTLQGTILEKVGADAVIYPERDMGARVAKSLMASAFTDWIELSPDYSMVEGVLPAEWEGKSLAELHVREEYGINVVGIIREEQVNVTLDPREPLRKEDVLILIGANDVLQKFHLGR